MRVTKIVREYIEKEVDKRYPKVDDAEYESLRSRIDEAKNYITEKTDAFAEELIKEVRDKFDIPEDVEIAKYYRYGNTISISDYNCNVYKSYNTKNAKRREEVRAKIEEILVKLELGGTRDEIDEMLSEIDE